MFGIFKKKQPTALDGVIRAIYGDHPPAKSADLERAVTIAHEDILCELVTLTEVRNVANGLFAGPIPYSTHDLAVAVALSFFKKPEHLNSLKDVQLAARLRVLNWMKDGKVARSVTTSFEDTLYTTFKPGPPPIPQPSPPPVPQDASSDREANFVMFKERNAGRSLDDAAEIVQDFMAWQHNFAEDEKPGDWEDEQQDHAERIERAFLLGATGMSAEAFSIAQADEDMLLLSVMGLYHDLDGEEAALEIERIFEASDIEEKAAKIGGAAMIDYLLNGERDENVVHLAALQKICWGQVAKVELKVKPEQVHSIISYNLGFQEGLKWQVAEAISEDDELIAATVVSSLYSPSEIVAGAQAGQSLDMDLDEAIACFVFASASAAAHAKRRSPLGKMMSKIEPQPSTTEHNHILLFNSVFALIEKIGPERTTQFGHKYAESLAALS